MPISTAPALVILAAGMGSRFGGMKQLAGLGPGGETLMDYSIFDAIQAGFGSAVFVIRPEMEEAVRDLATERYAAALPASTVHQRLDQLPYGIALPASRAKPWGTAQAVLAAAPAVAGPFAVVNADDFYGRAAFAALGAFLRHVRQHRQPRDTFGLVGYRLRDTLSPSGGVNRGVIETDARGAFEAIEEVTDIRETVPGELSGRAGDRQRALGGTALVSMNMWGFTPAVFDLLRDGFEQFLATADLVSDEYLLPSAIHAAVAAGRAQVEILPAESRWFGITYPEDGPAVSAALRDLGRDGTYPARLW